MSKTSQKYANLISQTDETIKAEQKTFTVKQAGLAFKAGLIALESEVTEYQAKVAVLESNVATADLALLTAKRAEPKQLFQGILNANRAVKQANLDLKAGQADLKDIEELFAEMQKMQKQLF